MAIIGAASLIGEERRCLEALKKLNGSRENPVELIKISEVSGLPINRVEKAIQRLIQRNKIQKTRDNKYYIECKGRR